VTRLAIRATADFWTGLVLAAVGIGFAALSLGYDLGSATRIGPGFFPFVLAAGLSLLGIAAAVRSFLLAGPAAISIGIRPNVLVLGAVVGFAALLRDAGLAVTLVLVLLVSARASDRFRWPTAVLLAGVASAASILVFVCGLGLPVPVLGHWLGGGAER
jgi:hypothetical protein